MISPRVSNRTSRSFRNVLRVLFCFLVLLFLPPLLLFLLVFLFVSSSSFTPILVILVKVFFLRVTLQSFQNGLKILRVPGPIRADDAGGISPVRP